MSRSWPEDTSRGRTRLSSAPRYTEQLLVPHREMALRGTVYQRILGAVLMNMTTYAPISQLISMQNMSDLRMYSHLPTPAGSSLSRRGRGKSVQTSLRKELADRVPHTDRDASTLVPGTWLPSAAGSIFVWRQNSTPSLPRHFLRKYWTEVLL